MSGNRNLDSDLKLAHRLADTARSISLSHFGKALKQKIKPDGSIVTNADEAVEDALRQLVEAEKPGDTMLGEERGQTGNSNRRWIVDAIDGTNSFVEGTKLWCTLIALEVDGQIVLGVCDQAPIDRRYWAVKGGGAYFSGVDTSIQRLKVSETSGLASARSFLPPPSFLRDTDSQMKASELSSITSPQPLTDHPALQVATGHHDVAILFRAGPWDLAAPSIVVEEAGGRFTDLKGGSELDTGGAVFSNGRIHDEVLQITSR